MAVNAIGDAPLNANSGRRGLNMWTSKVQTGTGANPIVVPTPLNVVTAAGIIETATAPGLTASVITVVPSGRNVNIYRWQPTSSSVTTLVASTTDILVNLQVLGTNP